MVGPQIKVTSALFNASIWVFRRKPSAKKNKTWEGDGLLHQKGSVVRFFSEDGSKL